MYFSAQKAGTGSLFSENLAGILALTGGHPVLESSWNIIAKYEWPPCHITFEVFVMIYGHVCQYCYV